MTPVTILRTVSAPGKVFWLGEYVVLDGAPAIASAVDRYAWLKFEPGGDSLRVTSTVWEGEMVLQDADGGVLHQAPTPAQRLVYAVAQRVLDLLGDIRWEAGILHIDTDALSARNKLGLGSSAAVAAGLTVALMGSRVDDRLRLLDIAQSAHHDFQGRVGSGADVAASMLGGVVLVQQGRAARRFDYMSAPGFMVFASSMPANTPDMIKAVRAWRNARPVQSRAALAIMADAANRGSFALRLDDEAGWIDSVERFGKAEIELSRLSNVPVVTPEMRQFMEAAASMGCPAKPSGAGGGDVLIAWPGRHTDLALIREIAEACGLLELTIRATDEGAIHSLAQPEETQPISLTREHAASTPESP
jgi:phosphomevalonate kinase